MEYFRDPRNQIQADIAYRLGMIAKQYRTLSMPAEQDFSVTLDVCILQNLLTTCTELLASMEKNEGQAHATLTADIEMGRAWGLRQKMIKTTFDEPLTGASVLRRLRHALCHPTTLDLDETFPSTGYTTIQDGSRTIRRYCFVNSPDIQRKKVARKLERTKGDGELPRVPRVFKIYLTPEEIHALVIGLSNHLAQPIRKDWDGVTIAQLVA